MRIKISRINSLKFLLWFSLVISIIIETLVLMEILPDNQIVKVVQYVLLLMPVGFSLLKMVTASKGLKKRVFWDELRSGFIVVLTFLILSLYRSITAGRFIFESIMQLFQIIVPFVFVYILINELREDDIAKFMKIAMWMTTTGYVAAVASNLNSFTSIFTISFLNSYSPFENSTFAEMASGLGAYFVYYRKKMPGYATAAVLLNLFIFKRVLMLMIIVLLIISLRDKQDKIVSNKLYKGACIGWIALIGIVYYIYQPSTVQLIRSRYDFDIVNFTMSRVYRLWYMYENNFTSYGLGSTTEFINAQRLPYLGSEFEMDFIRITFELGIIAIIVFVYEYLKITKRNNYAFCLVNLCFLNLLMANGLLKYWGWTFRILTIALINYGSYNNQNSVIGRMASSSLKSRKRLKI